ncbi:hypothetical protein PINS_up016776 [Pythium insidiosum]|nr:hypothetical protein PINS_up016776 [Pythium insidiosum]
MIHTTNASPSASNRRASSRRSTLGLGARRATAKAAAERGVVACEDAAAGRVPRRGEEHAARVLQRAARGYLGRLFVSRLLLQVYQKQYDPIEKEYFYVNTVTNETTWERPRALQLFLPSTTDVATRHVELTPHDAAKRIQRMARAFLASAMIKRMIRENYN